MRLELVEEAPWSEAAARDLERLISPVLRGSLHVTLIARAGHPRVPEPGPIPSLASGIALLGLLHRRRQTKA